MVRQSGFPGALKTTKNGPNKLCSKCLFGVPWWPQFGSDCGPQKWPLTKARNEIRSCHRGPKIGPHFGKKKDKPIKGPMVRQWLAAWWCVVLLVKMALVFGLCATRVFCHRFILRWSHVDAPMTVGEERFTKTSHWQLPPAQRKGPLGAKVRPTHLHAFVLARTTCRWPAKRNAKHPKLDY